MGFKLPFGNWERSNPMGSNQFFKDPLKGYVAHWVPDQFDPKSLQTEKGNKFPMELDKGKTLKFVYTVDGSRLTHPEPDTIINEVVFVRIADLRLPVNFVPSVITKATQEIERTKTLQQMILPLRGLRPRNKTIFETISEIVYTKLNQEHRKLLDTYKFLLYKKWLTTVGVRMPRNFLCPYCEVNGRTAHLPYNADIGQCSNPNCKHEIKVIDFLLAYSRRMGHRGDVESIPRTYMNDMERLSLIHEIRTIVESGQDVSEYLFVADGDLAVQDDEIQRSILRYFEYLQQNGHILHIVSQEKSGAFYEHAKYLDDFLEEYSVFIPSDDYIHYCILKRDDNPKYKTPRVIFGTYHNLGIKMFVKFGKHQILVLNIPRSKPRRSKTYEYKDIMGLSDILTTLNQFGLNSKQIKWIEYANRAVSMSQDEYDGLVRHYFGNLE